MRNSSAVPGPGGIIQLGGTPSLQALPGLRPTDIRYAAVRAADNGIFQQRPRVAGQLFMLVVRSMGKYMVCSIDGSTSELNGASFEGITSDNPHRWMHLIVLFECALLRDGDVLIVIG